MKRFVSVDIGNSSAKVAVYEDGSLREWSLLRDPLLEVMARVESLDADAVGYCTTRNLSPEEEAETLRQGWWQLDPQKSLPIKIDYLTPETLGADRVAAAAGAAAEYPGEAVLVVDCGTAMTLDFVSADAEFKGGNIAPGLDMRLRALHDFTSRLPKVLPLGPLPELGYDTDTAIRSGAIRGAIYEIIGTLRYLYREYDCRRLLLTGADDVIIDNPLKKELRLSGMADIEVSRIVELTSRGIMACYLYENEK